MGSTIKVIYIGYNLGWNLTPGKSYEIKNLNDSRFVDKYIIVNDMGVRYSYDKNLFKTLDEFRDGKIENILG